MPTPPRESIGGNNPRHLAALEFSQNEYNYLINTEVFKNSEEYQSISDDEKILIETEYDQRLGAYETLNKRVSEY